MKIELHRIRTKHSKCQLPDSAVIVRCGVLVNSKTGQEFDPPEYEITYYLTAAAAPPKGRRE